ncbi:MAG: energy-coupling factor transporter ATPase, partial [Desulfotomaculaceae bacterium]|nr:energy-coupling factor transporter ATPase [Desulfotomaculaceae bacterium]
LSRMRGSMGVTIVLLTHQMEEAAEADRIIVMSGGSPKLAGTPAEVFSMDELLQDLGLELPVAAKIARRLRRRGFLVPENIITVRDMVSYICR